MRAILAEMSLISFELIFFPPSVKSDLAYVWECKKQRGAVMNDKTKYTLTRTRARR